MNDSATLIHLTRCLLESIVAGDWNTYSDLCDPSLSCFEPEAKGNLIEGMDFHRFYFNLDRKGVQIQTTLAQPHVRLMGDVAVVSYIRVTQIVGSDTRSDPVTKTVEETRVWQRIEGNWKHVHFHRSGVNS